jgi:hypothetical protein
MRALVATVAVATIFAAPTQAADVRISQTEGLFAQTFFASPDATDPCIVWQAAVSASIASFAAGQKPAPGLFIIVEEDNNCTGETAIWIAGGLLPARALVISPNLDSASLDATLEFCDEISGSCVPGEVHLTWTGTGPVTTSNPIHSKLVGDTCMIQSVLTEGRSRSTSTTGTIAIGGDTIALEAEGVLTSGRGIDVEIGCSG